LHETNELVNATDNVVCIRSSGARQRPQSVWGQGSRHGQLTTRWDGERQEEGEHGYRRPRL